MCQRNLFKIVSLAVLSFGLGIVLSFFLAVLSFGLGIVLSFFIPEGVLVIIEALLIMAVGVLCFLQK